jgi:acyl carrier protein
MPNNDREAIFQKTREIVMEVLDVGAEDVSPESKLIDDLGAESIDFLDLSFKIEKEFGIKLPEREITQLGNTIRDKRIEVIEDLLKQKFDLTMADEERDELADMELSSIIEKLNQTYNIEIGADLLEKGSEMVTSKIIDHLGKLGFVISEAKLQDLPGVTIEDSPVKIQKIVMDMFTVQLLADFVIESRSAAAEIS